MLVDHFGGGDAGWAKVKQLLANTKVLNRSSLVFQGVGNGEYPLGISLEYAGYVWAAGGAPVKTIYPADGTHRADGRRRRHQGRSERGGRQGVRRLHQPQGRARDDRQGAPSAVPRARISSSPSCRAACRPLSSLKLLPYKEEAWTAARAPTLEKIKDIVQETR